MPAWPSGLERIFCIVYIGPASPKLLMLTWRAKIALGMGLLGRPANFRFPPIADIRTDSYRHPAPLAIAAFGSLWRDLLVRGN